MTVTVYYFDYASKIYLGMGQSSPDPLNPNNTLIPGNATTVAPPTVDPTAQAAYWNGTSWDVETINEGTQPTSVPAPVAPAPPQPTQQQILEQQIAALENQQTPRMYREWAVGSTVTNKNWVNPDGSFRTSAQQLAWLDQQIDPLRTQLQQLLSQNQTSQSSQTSQTNQSSQSS